MDAIEPGFREPSIDSLDTERLLANAAAQAKARGYDDIFILDADSHHYETEYFSEILPFIDDPVLRQLAQKKQGGGAAVQGLLVSQLGLQDMGGRITRYPLRATEQTPPAPHRDITLTKRWMNQLGVDVACVFPTPMLSLGLHPQRNVEVSLARAYNCWLIETLLEVEPRFISMLYLPLNDAAASVRIIEEFGDRRGVKGFMTSAGRYMSVHDDEKMKVYVALEERGLALAFHASYNWFEPSFMHINRFISMHALGFTFHNMLHLTNWVMNGIPERFPRLKVIWLESGLAWVVFLMQRLDNEYRMRSSEAPALRKLPSDYIRDMFFTTQPMEGVEHPELLEMTFRMIKADTQLLYASDYPHWDFDMPSTVYDLPFLDEQARRNILGLNAARVLGVEPAIAEPKLGRRK
jgi:predicted TIM-barrel fold metal-dependent hydrolase